MPLANINFVIDILSVATIVILIVVFYFGYKQISLNIWLRRHGKQANATILSIKNQYKFQILKLRIEPHDRSSFEAETNVTRYSNEPFHVGDQITVLINPEKPTEFVLEHPFGKK